MFKYKNMHTVESFDLSDLEGWTFDQMAVELWDRLRRRPGGGFPGLKTDYPTSERYPVKFSWQDPKGGWAFITGAENVLMFVHRTGAREIQYYVETLGAAAEFDRHASEVTARPDDFGEWAWSRTPDGTGQLEKDVLDVYQRAVQVTVRASPGYPASPPEVFSKPPISDPCFWNGGTLCYARAEAAGQLVWADYAAAANPLAVLLDELRRKYHIL